jgi:hypothetical protein
MDRRRGPADGASMPYDRPARGSLAELRLRLERLPAGHPSSPYDETGARRPSPEQLRQLELPLADEDEHPIRSSLLTPATEARPAPARAGPARAGPARAGPASTGPASTGPASTGPAAAPGLVSGAVPGFGAAAAVAGAPDPARSDPGPDGLDRAAYGASEFSPATAGLNGADRAAPGFGDPEFGDREPGDPDPSDPGLSAGGRDQPGPGQPDRFGTGRYENGRYENGRPGNGRPETAGPGRGPARNGQPGPGDQDPYSPGDEDPYGYSPAGNGRNGSRQNGLAARRDDLDDPDEYAGRGAARPAPGGPVRSGPRPADDLGTADPLAPVPTAGVRPARNGSRGHDDLDASGLLPRVSDPDPLATRNGYRGHDDPDAPGFPPRVPAADDARPARNGAYGHEDPAASGLLPRVGDAGPRPAANGYGGRDDLAAPGLLPPVSSADPLPDRDGPRGRAALDEPGLPARNGAGPPRGTPGDPLPPRGGSHDPFSSEWQGPDGAGRSQNGHPRARPGLDELERARIPARPGRPGPGSADPAPGGPAPGERMPARVAPRDHLAAEPRADDPPARRHQGLTPDQESIADQALSRYKAADGRNVFGGYGESGLTPAMRRVEAHLPHGRLAPDSDENSLKSAERFKDKLARMIARHPGIPAADLAAEIYDAARYTFVFEPEDYTDGTWLVHRRLKAQGFDLEARRNRWDTPEFKGIRTRWRDPAHDLAFEVQFHTPASWDVMQRTHEAYRRITDPRTSPAERAELRERQVAAAAGTRPPARCAEIGDFRADVR